LFSVIVKKALLRKIKKENPKIKKKIFDSLRKLENPFSLPYEKLKGEENVYRIRVGEFRIIYYLDKGKREVIVLRIKRRSKAYKDM
jgi:mRNA interferase RelE/StbE